MILVAMLYGLTGGKEHLLGGGKKKMSQKW